MIAAQELRQKKFRGPVAFYDGANGMARQDFECIDLPRFGYAWQRQGVNDRGRQFYMVDGAEVADFDEAARLLNSPAKPDSPAEQRRRSIDEFRASPPVGGATRALSEARCNADAGPFGMIRAWMRRADNSYHQGINQISDEARKKDGSRPRWLYTVKSAAHETYRAMYLFAQDRKQDSGLQCAMGTRCRDCPMLLTIEAAMIAARSRPFPAETDDADVDAAKAWTCIGHMLTAQVDPIDGAFFSTEQDRNRSDFY